MALWEVLHWNGLRCFVGIVGSDVGKFFDHIDQFTDDSSCSTNETGLRGFRAPCPFLSSRSTFGFGSSWYKCLLQTFWRVATGLRLSAVACVLVGGTSLPGRLWTVNRKPPSSAGGGRTSFTRTGGGRLCTLVLSPTSGVCTVALSPTSSFLCW